MTPDGDEATGGRREFMCEACKSDSCYHLLLAGRVTSIHMSETAPRPSPLDNDGLLREILLRLPAQPSSLPRASLVRKSWSRLISEPQFLRRFRAHHRNPPLLGFFGSSESSFRPILDPPDRVPPERFSLEHISEWLVLACRHGRLLLINRSQTEVSVRDPITGDHVHAAVPAAFASHVFLVKGTLLCADGDQGHVHGGCHSSPFKVILVSMRGEDRQPIACVYSSDTGMWGDIVSVPQRILAVGDFSILLGNSVYWLVTLMNDVGTLEFSLDSLSLTLIHGPIRRYAHRMLIHAKDGGVGNAILAYPNLHIWHRKVDSHGVATWVLCKTVDLQTVLGLPKTERRRTSFQTPIERLVGYVEDAHAILLYVDSCVFMVQLDSMESKRLWANSDHRCDYHPFMSFYTGGKAIAGAREGAQMLRNA